MMGAPFKEQPISIPTHEQTGVTAGAVMRARGMRMRELP